MCATIAGRVVVGGVDIVVTTVDAGVGVVANDTTVGCSGVAVVITATVVSVCGVVEFVAVGWLSTVWLLSVWLSCVLVPRIVSPVLPLVVVCRVWRCVVAVGGG